MNELSKYLVEQILLEETTSIKKTIVVYVGRFQPFHKGHYGTYSHLVKKFGKDNVYIGTSNKVERPKSPFNFKEKKQIMTTMFGVPSNKIFEVKNPYAPLEILKKFDEKTTAFITVVGEKDAGRLGGKYFKKWDGEATEGYKDRGYVYASPMQGDSVSGTEVRIGLGSGTEEQKRNFFLDRAYSKFNKTIFSLITNKLQESCIRLTKTQLEDLLIEVSSGIGQDMVDDGPVIFLPDYNSFKVINAERAQQIGWEIINMVMDDSMDDYITYPEGPTGRVTFFPRGAIGKKDPMGEFDVMVNGAYDKWYKHATRTASLVGYSVVDKALGVDDKLSTDLAKGAKPLAKESDKTIQRESITLPVEIGDTLLMGKFKNKKVVVKTIGKDEHGMPTINGKKVVTFRLVKEGKQVFFEGDKEDERYTHIGYGRYKEKGKEKDSSSPIFKKDDSGKYTPLESGNSKPKDKPKQNIFSKDSEYKDSLSSNDPAKKQEPKSGVNTFQGAKSGKEIQTTELEGGGQVFGTVHGNNKMVDDILDKVKSTIPQDRWKDVVFVGEGGMSNDNNELEFGGEMKYAADKFQKIGASVDTWDGDETNVFDNQSPLYKYQEQETGLSNEEIMASNWASMIGQGDSIEDMSPEDYLTDSGKSFLQQSAQEANLPLSNQWDSNPSEEDIDTLYRLSFADDYGDKKTKVNDAQESFNKFRDVNLLRKTKELSSQGKIPIVLAGESHVGLVDNMMQNEWMGSDPIMMEALTQSQRAARRWTFAKNKKLINIKKQRTHIRKKTYSVLSKRAHKLAYLYVRKEWTQRLFGMTPYAELSLPNKQRVSQVVQKKKRKILKLAKFRFLPALKQKEADRFKNVHQYPSNLTFDTSTNENKFEDVQVELDDSIDEVNTGFYDGVRGSMTANDAAGATGYMYNHDWDEYDTQEYYLANLPGFELVHEVPSEFELERAIDQGLPLMVHGDGGKTTKYNRILKADFTAPEEFSKSKKSIKIKETIQKVDNKWVVYNKTGGEKLGTHETYEEALKQLREIELDKFKKINSKIEETYTKGNIFGGKIKIGGLAVPLEVELIGADNKKKVFIVKVVHIDSKYHSKLPSNGILEIPARIFRMPGGGWYKVKTKSAFEGIAMGYPDQEWMDNHEKEMKKLRKQLDKQQKETYK